MADEQKRSTKLTKQVEIEDDDDGEDGKSECSASTAIAGVPSPTVQSATSSSGTSPEETQPKAIKQPMTLTRKQTLIRTPALDGTSPPPESFFSSIKSNGSTEGLHISNGAVGGSFDKRKKNSTNEAKEYLLTQHKVSSDSGHGTIDHNDGLSDISLSRDSSLETGSSSKSDIYKDSSGVDMKKFMRDTLVKSQKDRKTVLAYEAQILDFISKDNTTLTMPEMTSYDRMIVHRLAAYVGLEHNVDASGKCVILNKTENTRYAKLSKEVMDEEAPPKTILQKKTSSLDEYKSHRSSKGQFTTRAKSLEERQQNYNEARERIFKNDESGEGPGMPTLLTTSYHGHMPTQRSFDSIKNNTSSRWTSQDSSGYGMDSSTLRGARLRANMTKSNSYGGTAAIGPSASHFCISPHGSGSLNQAESAKETATGSPTPHAGCLPPTPSTTPGELGLAPSTPEGSSITHQCPTSFAYLVSSDYTSIPVGSLIINPHTMQPHVNSDGTLYQFDPSCPPPFMLQPPPQQPPATPPSSNMYAQEMVDISGRLASASITPLESGSEAFPMGVPSQPMHVVPHHQSVYTSTHPTPPFSQPQFYTTPLQPTNANVRFVAVPVPQGHGQPVFPASPLDSQGQATVPMPNVGVPAVLGAGGYQVVQPQQHHYQQAGGNPQHSLDLGTGYHYSPAHETVVVSSAGGMSSSVPVGTPGATHIIPAYNITYTQPAHQQSSVNQYNTNASAPTGTTFYTVPHTPTPPLALTQPPPSSHHQQPPQQTVFYQPSAGNLTLSPVSYSASKPLSTPFIQNLYRPSTPPQQPQQQQQIHPHHHQQQPQQAVAASSNGHHTGPLTLNYGQPMTFSPAGQPLTHLPTQGAPLVAFQPNPYQVRPVGTVIQLAGSPAQQPMSGTQVQSYQVIRPSGPAQDIRTINQGGGVRPRLSSLPLSTPHIQQSQPRQKTGGGNRQPKSRGKKGRESEEYSGPHGGTTPHQMGHIGLMAPLLPNMNISGHGQPHLPSAPSNRQ